MSAVRIALTRPVSPRIAECELTHLEREPIDYARAVAQHDDYEALLRSLGCEVIRLDADPSLADAVFIEDTAVVVDEVAVITRPGAESRRGEIAGVAEALAQYRELRRIEAPATIDGGDVLRIGRRVYVGMSERTNRDGGRQLRDALAPFRYEVIEIEFRGALHLKTAVTAISDEAVIINPAWIDPHDFARYEIVECDPEEPFGANVLRVGETVVVAAAHPRTRERIAQRGVRTVTVDASELAKAEGGLTCCSLLL